MIDLSDTVAVTVRQATIQDALTREKLKKAATSVVEALTYADLMSVTVAVKGLPWPLTFEALAAVPETVLERWEDAVYRLNPAWTEKPRPVKDITPQLLAWVKQKNDVGDLPHTHQIYDYDTAAFILDLLEALQWRWPIDVILRQPEQLLSDVLALSLLRAQMKETRIK